ncbi:MULTISPECIES: low temperature requirement protein A [Miniimonas]|uniref:low temperature requirement protein A n=1 Tax=Miniimonas TaxID=947525 RepID=UPI001F2A620B|nr:MULTISPECIES: low temperature requirement protein A [Miniimonas]
MTTAHEDAGDALGPGARRGVAHRIRRHGGRDPHEAHRVATPLELLFDLTFAAAFGVAGNQMTHLLELGHQAQAVGAFAFAMMAIVWAWINFTWFASAFDTDDWLFRVTTMVQMAGVLVLALGLPALFRSVDEGGVIATASWSRATS